MKDSKRTTLSAILWGAFALGCGVDTIANESEMPAERPEVVDSLLRTFESRPLPEEFGSELQILHTDLGTLLGSSSGLYGLLPKGVTRLDPTPVVDLAMHNGVIFVAHADALHTWDGGQLTKSVLDEVLNEGQFTGLMTQGDALWVTTTEGVFQYRNNEIISLMDPIDARSIHGGNDSSYLATSVGDSGDLLVIEPGDENWQVLDFHGSVMTDIRPGGQALYGLLDGSLFKYLTLDDAAVWRRTVLTMDEGAGPEIRVINTSTEGQLWGLASGIIFQHSGSTVSTITREEHMEAQAFIVDAQRAAWLSDGETLATYFEIPPTTLDVSWHGSVAAFAEANCTRCHGSLGTAHPLHTQAQWSSEIDKIIQTLETQSMPADGQALFLGDVALIRAWKDGGLL